MNHGIIDVFAYQEALLIEAIFGIAILTMIWVGFRRWLQHKERLGRLIAQQTAERSAQCGAHIEDIEKRLKSIERLVSNGRTQSAAQIVASASDTHSDPILNRDGV